MKAIEQLHGKKDAVAQDNAELAFERRLKLTDKSIDLNHAGLFNFLKRLTGNHADAEDLIAKLWKIVLLKFPEDQIMSSPLLYAKARQVFYDFYRDRTRRGEIILSDVPETTVVHHLSQEAYSDEEEAALKDRFWEQFPGISLTEMQKEVIYVYARYGYTYQEIEDILGVPSSTVCDWVALARKLLSKYVTLQK
ncbi:sigma-70 family RNA polymerase sigma factor [Puniceicoccaceae bacterium K14]|nr:sigma-70 family RNA polymerase sigma factor [Puniceicoccaceae bacterium K14]